MKLVGKMYRRDTLGDSGEDCSLESSLSLELIELRDILLRILSETFRRILFTQNKNYFEISK